MQQITENRSLHIPGSIFLIRLAMNITLLPFMTVNALLFLVPVVLIYIGFQEYNLTQGVSDEQIIGGIALIFSFFGGWFDSVPAVPGGLWAIFFLILLIQYLFKKAISYLQGRGKIPRPSFLMQCVMITTFYFVLYAGAEISVWIVNKGVQVIEIGGFLFIVCAVAILSALATISIDRGFEYLIRAIERSITTEKT